MLHGNWYRRKEDRKHYKNIRTCIVLDWVLRKGLIDKISHVNYQMVYDVKECSGSEGVSKSPGGLYRHVCAHIVYVCILHMCVHM